MTGNMNGDLTNGFRPVQIWTQTVSGGYTGGTITFDKKYNVVDVIYSKGDGTSGQKLTTRMYTGYVYSLESIYGGYLRVRTADFRTAGKIIFSNGLFGQVVGELSTNDLQCIPHKIYGYVL